MDHVGHYAPDHEAVGLIHTDGGEMLVPRHKPTEGAALIYLKLLDGELAIHKGDDEVAVGGLYLAVYYGQVAIQNASIRHAVARDADIESRLTMTYQDIVEVYLSLHIVLGRGGESCFYALFCQRDGSLLPNLSRMNCQL